MSTPITHEFTIDRKKWVNGSHRTRTRGEAALLNEKGYMCCLGIYENSLGVTKKELLGLEGPGELVRAHGELWDMEGDQPDNWLLMSFNGMTPPWYSSDIADTLMSINDDITMTAKEREKQIKRIFREHGVKVTFK